MTDIDIDYVTELYHKYRDDLAIARDRQRKLLRRNENRTGMRAQLDDVEAELSYLLVRASQPNTVLEIGALHGWSTTWLLRALADTGSGRLITCDRLPHARRNVPSELADGRWEFVLGDVRQRLAALPRSIDYLFLDAAHDARFANWYLKTIMPTLPPATPVSVHDVFHTARTLPLSEGRTVLHWLRRNDIAHFTASRARTPQVYRALSNTRRELGLIEPVHHGTHNPMIFFSTR